MPFKGIAAIAVALGTVAATAAYGATRETPSLLRPPGALHEGGFFERCVKCGRCIEACPYRCIVAAPRDAGFQAGTPVIDPRAHACRMCDGFPCSTACPTGALEPVATRDEVRMGTARVNKDLCISYVGNRCEVCYRACPLIDEAITIEFAAREGDAIHAIFEPVINEDVCTGCGLCVERCVVSEPALAITIEPAT